MEEVIVLLNFNKYLGGGETLMVRYSEYLNNNKIKFLCFCSEQSYIYSDLKKKINKLFLHKTYFKSEYYYLNELKRKEIIDEIRFKIGKKSKVSLVSFCFRDLYIALDLSKKIKNCSITHLALHPQDNLYLGQTLFDKFIYKFFRVRNFSFKKNLVINQRILKIINKHNGLISMGKILNLHWKNTFGIQISDNQIVPLPSFIDIDKNIDKKFNSKKIIWIGRIVDFKIPAILAMIHFVSDNIEYEFSIVGKGNVKKIKKYIKKFSLDTKRIHFKGEIAYQDLETAINQHSIGYAMGTSLIELAKYKMPVIVALASFDHKIFKNQICGGLFFDKPQGCDGSDLLLKSQKLIKTTISNSIEEIEFDFDKASQNCYEYAKNNFDTDLNFKKYTEIIMRSKILTEREKIQIPRSSFIRKLVFNCVNND